MKVLNVLCDILLVYTGFAIVIVAFAFDGGTLTFARAVELELGHAVAGGLALLAKKALEEAMDDRDEK